MDDKLFYNNDDEEIILTSVELVNSMRQDTENEGYKEAENSPITLAHSKKIKLYCASKRKSHKKSSHKKRRKRKKRSTLTLQNILSKKPGPNLSNNHSQRDIPYGRNKIPLLV